MVIKQVIILKNLKIHLLKFGINKVDSSFNKLFLKYNNLTIF